MSTISETIKRDHQAIRECADNIRTAKDEDSKAKWQNQFTWELARHSIGEELVVYPAFEKHLGADGKQRADKDRAEHQSVKDALYHFQGLAPSNEDFLPTLEKLMKDLNEHIEEEEKDDLPTLENALSHSDSESMANSFGRTKAFVPTRSHPMAPDKPPFETAAGLLAAPIDRLMDLFKDFPDEHSVHNKTSK